MTLAKKPTVKEILLLADGFLARCKIGQSRLEAEVLLAAVLATKRIELYINFDRPLSANELENMRIALRRRSRGEPLAYILGEKEFMSLPFSVDSSVLIPRPETEHLVEKALGLIKDRGFKRLVDVGTGSGAIAVSLAFYAPSLQVLAIDLAEEALEVAKQNAHRHGVLGRIEFLKGNLLESLQNDKGNYDLVLANPPYIPSQEIANLALEVRQEPRLALDGGPDGLACYQPLTRDAYSILKNEGYLGLEIGYDQGQAVSKILQAEGFSDITIVQDYGGLDRCVWGKK